jgi:LmbE family N-acetylglucosaminyl deacetylase
MKRSAWWWKTALAGTAWAAYRYQPLRVCLRPGRPLETDPRVTSEQVGLFRPDARVLIVTAHPDDTEFYLGGTLLRLAEAGARLHLVVATDGDKGYYPFARPDALRQLRRQEQRAAAAQWQAEEVRFLGQRDGRLSCSETLVGQIEGELRRIEPEYVLLFEYRWPPLVAHQDHLRAGEATFAAMRHTGIEAWALHFATGAPNLWVDVSSCWARRLALLAYHRSQWHDARYRRVRALITHTARRDGRRMGTLFAEGLRCARGVEMAALLSSTAHPEEGDCCSRYRGP